MLNHVEWPMVLVFVGALLSATGAIWSSVRQNQEKLASANERVAFETDLRNKSDEIAHLNRQLAATVTGGDTYCYLFISRPSEQNSRSQVILFTEGQYPLYDVSLKIDDVNRMIAIVKDRFDSGAVQKETWEESWNAVSSASDVLQIGNLGPSQGRILGAIQFPKDGSFRLNIQITARNGMIHQYFRFLKVDQEWIRVEKVLRGEEVLKEMIDPRMPKNAAGEFEW